MEMTNLKPCPFCGGEAKSSEKQVLSSEHGAAGSLESIAQSAASELQRTITR